MVAISQLLVGAGTALSLAFQAIAIPWPAPAANIAINGLLKRQTGNTDSPLGDVPDICQSECENFRDQLNSCPDDNCFCTDKTMRYYASCLDCGVKATNGQLTESQAQDAVDSLASRCNEEGFGVESASVASSGTIRSNVLGTEMLAVAIISVTAAFVL